MLQVPYPTMERNFIVPPNELELPESENPEYINNHHGYWPYKKLGQFLLIRTFRDLNSNQFDMPYDTHTANRYGTSLHQRFSPPERLPSLKDMIERIEIAKESGEQLKVQENRRGPYFYHQISHITLKQIHMEYNRLNENKRVA